MPIKYAEYCNGRVCAKCGKCRDWYFTGDSRILSWMQNVANWQSKDWQRWHNEKIWEKFKRRNGHKCTYEFTYAFSYDTLVRRGYHDNNDCIDANNRHFGTDRIGCYQFRSDDGGSRFSFDYAYSTVEGRHGAFNVRSFCMCVNNCQD